MPTPPDEAILKSLSQFIEQGIPFNRFMGLLVERIAHGEAVIRIPWRDEFIGDPFRPALHGGVVSTLIDVTGGAACFAALTSYKDRVSTVDLRVDYLRPVTKLDLICLAKVVRMGNRVASVQMVVHAGELPDGASADATPAEGSEPIATGRAVYNVSRADRGHADRGQTPPLDIWKG